MPFASRVMSRIFHCGSLQSSHSIASSVCLHRGAVTLLSGPLSCVRLRPPCQVPPKEVHGEASQQGLHAGEASCLGCSAQCRGAPRHHRGTPQGESVSAVGFPSMQASLRLLFPPVMQAAVVGGIRLQLARPPPFPTKAPAPLIPSSFLLSHYENGMGVDARFARSAC